MKTIPAEFDLANNSLNKTVEFLRPVGLDVQFAENVRGMFPGTLIWRGVLLIDRLARPSTVLHEAGHLAIIPTQYRRRVSRDPEMILARAFRDADACKIHPDDPFMRALIQASDTEATAWAWAAGWAIGLPPAEIIQDDEYGANGRDVRSQVSAGQYFGIHGLAHAGMCQLPRRSGGFPEMTKWLQDASLEL